MRSGGQVSSGHRAGAGLKEMNRRLAAVTLSNEQRAPDHVDGSLDKQVGRLEVGP